MNRSIENLIGVLINIPILGCYRYVSVAVHHGMVEEFSDHIAVISATFAQFKKEFEKINWTTCRLYRESLFTIDSDDQFHAGVISMNGAWYKLTTYGLIRANILRRRKIKELNRKRIARV
jgi:hypothetical protein